MNLPPLSLPKFELPFAVDLLLHPIVVHFAIVLPVIVLLLEIINLFAKSRAVSWTSFFLLLLAAASMFAAYVTGGVDGKEVYALLSMDGQAELKEHKLLGTYVLLATGVVLIVKLLSMLIQTGIMKSIFVLLLAVLIAGLVEQGHDGGELVYEYGAHVEKVSELDDQVFELEEQVGELEETIEEQKESLLEIDTLVKTLQADKSAAVSVEAQTTPVEESSLAEVAQPADTSVDVEITEVSIEAPASVEHSSVEQ